MTLCSRSARGRAVSVALLACLLCGAATAALAQGTPPKPAAAVPASAAPKPAAAALAKSPQPAANAAGAARGSLAKLPPIEQFSLSNGLRVAVVTTTMIPQVSVQLWYRAGSKDEPRDRRGVAQLVARMMWKGSRRVRPDAHAQLIGALGGQVVGGTDEDSAHFGDEVPRGYLDFALQLEAERMRGLQLRESAVRAERELLLKELRQEEASPIARGLRRLLELAFTKHPYAWPSGGVVADLPAITTADVQRFYDTYYVPNNALLVVVGDVTVDEVKQSARAHFEPLPAAPVTRTAGSDAEPVPTAPRREVAAVGQLGLVMLGYPVPAATSPDWAALQIAATVLGSGDGSRIKRRLLAAGKELALDGGVSAQPREHPSLFIALAAYRDAAGGAAVEAALAEEINALAQRGPSKDELRIAKNQLQTRLAFALEGDDGVASQLGRSWVLSDDAAAFLSDFDRIEAVKPEDVKRVLATYLTPQRSTTLAVPPAAKATKP
jgi:zinc protease